MTDSILARQQKAEADSTPENTLLKKREKTPT